MLSTYASRERAAQRSACAARPEQQADEQADAAADRDVLDAQQPDLPADGLDDVVKEHERQRERGLPGRERDRRRREAGEAGSRSAAGTRAASCPSRSARAAHRRRRSRRPCRRARAGRSARCSARSSAAPRARRARPRTSAARRPRWRRATASASPAAPRTLLCSQTELRSTCDVARCCAALSGPTSPCGWRPSRRCGQLRRSAAAARSMLTAMLVTAKPSSCARKLGSSEVMKSPVDGSRRSPRASASPRLERSPSASADSARTGSTAVAPSSIRATESRRSSIAACSSEQSPPIVESSSAPRSRTVAAADLDGAHVAIDRRTVAWRVLPARRSR